MPRDVKILDRQCYASGVTIIEQGSKGNRAFIVESGKVEVFLRDVEGENMTIAILGPGSLIGEVALINDSQRVASVKTIEPTVLVTISYSDFKEAMVKSQALKKSLTDKAQRRIVETIGIIDTQTQPDKIRKRTDKAEIIAMRNRLQHTLEQIQFKAKKDLQYPK